MGGFRCRRLHVVWHQRFRRPHRNCSIPGYASTGTDISELTVAGIDNPVTVEVSGSIPYIIPGSGTFASCFTSALTNTNVSATASEFELPVLSPEFTVAPVFCEGGTVEFWT